jgi:DsbC/DsbD-like thiol-disulfide interchange protein
LSQPFVFSIQNGGEARRRYMKHNSAIPARWSAAAGVLGLLACASCAFGQASATGPHTTVTLVSDRGSLTPGGHVLVGLRFQMEKGWHVYWENPGDSGEPPKVQWQLPAGFHAGAIEWPTPEKLTAPSIVDYGYENEVLLMVPVSVPARLKSAGDETVSAKVNWLVCREMCIPGKAEVSLALPVNTASDKTKSGGNSAASALFRETHAKLPLRAPANWKVSAIAEKDDFVLTVETGKQEPAATFFPLDAEQIKNDAPEAATPFADGVRLRLQKSDGLLKPIAQLRGVLEFGSGRAYQIIAPVRSATTGNS